jgi:hypothetical protein
MRLTRSAVYWNLPIWTYVGGVPAVGMFMFGQHFAMRSKGLWMKGKEGHFLRAEYFLLKARHEYTQPLFYVLVAFQKKSRCKSKKPKSGIIFP